MATTWHVGVTSDEQGNNELIPMEEFTTVEEAKVRAFDLMSEGGQTAHIRYSKTRVYECFQVSRVLCDDKFVFIFGSAF